MCVGSSELSVFKSVDPESLQHIARQVEKSRFN